MPPRPIQQILEANATRIFARLLMTFMFWWEALGFATHFSASTGALNVLHLQPMWLMPAITLAALFIGSILVILDRYLWLGAGILSVFTLLTILLVHHFWTMPPGPVAEAQRREVEEHCAVIGGFIALTMVSYYRKRGVVAAA
jgi:transmembrane protein